MEDYDELERSDQIWGILEKFGIPMRDFDTITEIMMAIIDSNPHLTQEEKIKWKEKIYSSEKIAAITGDPYNIPYMRRRSFAQKELPNISPGLVHDLEVWRELNQAPPNTYQEKFRAFVDLISASQNQQFDKIVSILEEYPDLINEDMRGGIRTESVDTMLDHILMNLGNQLHELAGSQNWNEMQQILDEHLSFLKLLQEKGANFNADRQRNLLVDLDLRTIPREVTNFPKLILFLMEAMKPQKPHRKFMEAMEDTGKKEIVDAYTGGENYPKLEAPKSVFKQSCNKDIWFGEKCSQCAEIPLLTLRKIAIQLGMEPSFDQDYLCVAVATKIANIFNETPDSLVVALSDNELNDWSLKTIEPRPETVRDLRMRVEDTIYGGDYEIVIDNVNRTRDSNLPLNDYTIVTLRDRTFPYPVDASELESSESIDRDSTSEVLIFDVLNAEEVPLAQYLADNDDNIAFLILNRSGKVQSAMGYYRSQLKKEFKNREFYYECKTSQIPSLETIERYDPYMQIKGVVTVYVPASEVAAVLRSDQSLFGLLPSDEYLNRSTSISSVQVDWGYDWRGREINVQGLDHCQDRTRKQKWNILIAPN